MSRRLCLALLALLALALYWPAMQGRPFYEDWRALLEEGGFSRLEVPGRWLTSYSYEVQAARPLLEWHLVSFSLHIICVGLVYAVARAWALSETAALVAAAALLLSPGASQAVAYASARGELFIALFALAAAARADWRVWLVCGVGLMLSKEVGALPGALLVCAALYRVGLGGLTASAVALLIGALFVLKWRALTGLGWASWDGLALLPRHLAVFVLPGLVTPSVDPAPAAAWLLGSVALLPVAVAAWVVVPRLRLLLEILALLWAPRLVVFSGDAPQEHHAYLAMAVLALGVGLLWDWAGRPAEVRRLCYDEPY